MKYYTGIGSRKTPESMRKIMTQLAALLYLHGWTLRSGGAKGADQAFEYEADQMYRAAQKIIPSLKETRKIIYTPWDNFHDVETEIDAVNDDAAIMPLSDLPKRYQNRCYQLAEQVHPNWDCLKQGAKKLHARNILQITGHTGVRSEFVIYWSPIDSQGNPTGGTATAVNYAKSLGVPTYNLIKREQQIALKQLLIDKYGLKP